MENFSLSKSILLPQIALKHRISDSTRTSDSSEDFLKKKIILSRCTSSVTLEEEALYCRQKSIFAQYLFNLDSKQAQLYFLQMRTICIDNKQKDINSQFYCINLSKNQDDQQGLVITYFINIWLRSIGYGTLKNKRYLQGRIKLFVGHQALHSFSKIYDNLNLIPLDILQKRKLFLQICQNGWQYFIQFILKNDQLMRLLMIDNQKQQKSTCISIRKGIVKFSN